MKLKTVFNNVVKWVDAEEQGNQLFLTFKFYRPLIEEIKAMRGAKWNPELKCWSIDICSRNMFAFKVLANHSEYLHYLDANFEQFRPKIDSTLWKHQLEIYAVEKHHKRCIIAAEMRTGKTLPTIIVFLESGHDICWWVTTKKAALSLEREIYKWFPSVNLDRFKIMTYDKFTSIFNTLTESDVGNVIPPFIVFDECHKLKTQHSQRGQAALVASEMLENKYKNIEYCICLSGSPAPKDPSDWWTQCEVARAGFVREGTIQKFRNRYGKFKPYDPDNPVPAWERFEAWSEEEVFNLSKRLKGLVFVYLQKDCLDLPPKRYEIIRLNPSSELLRVAKMIVDTEDNQLTARQKLRQISDGFEYVKKYDEVLNVQIKSTNFLGSPKIDQLKTDLDEHEDVGRLVIYAGFHGSIDIITKTCLEAGWSVLQIDGRGTFLHKVSKTVPILEYTTTAEKSELLMALGEMDRSTDTHKMFKLAVVAHPQSGGAGMEFSSSPTFIYYSNDDSGEGRIQSESRGYSNNMDKTRGCTIVDYILLPTDELIRSKLFEKKDLQYLSMGQLKECLESYTSEKDFRPEFDPPW